MMNEEAYRTRVKICGLTNLEDARYVSGALADYLGFIFYEKSPRYIEPPKAGAIINWIEGPETVGVFVNQPLDDVNLIVRQTGIDLVQLHGTESPDYCRTAYLLFDTKTDNLWGGTGITFDWKILSDITDKKPFFLSGGLHAGNIRKASKTARPFAVDLSSGVEQAPGVKDYDKLDRFFEQMSKIWELQKEGL
jgi:phosphoribosylanthranilate isomerase